MDKSEVRVHTLGTDDWRGIQDFPYSCSRVPGIFSYQKLPQPDLDNDSWTLGVLMECLCIFGRSSKFLDVWIMKEYGNKESWTKLYHVRHMEDRHLRAYRKASYVFVNDQLLMDFYKLRSSNELTLAVYDSKNDSLKIVGIQNIDRWMNPEVYIESLISPCS
ncbi:F-box protein [Trifolium medium]|uniref:F-box protein n=1 Tax=Trifolium medium TaxID=97028 RepID=A0A392MIT4_9FABA|nr:F-box protein [Trifolium medium]